MERNREPRKNSHIYDQLIYNKRIYNGSKTMLSINGDKKTAQSHAEE